MDKNPDDDSGRERERERLLREEQARQAEQLRQQEAQKTEAARVEELARQQAEHQVRQLETLRDQRARLDAFEAEQRRQADDARQEEERKRQAEAQGKAAEGEVRNAGDRYRVALGQHYDVMNPYGSLARAAMAEYGAFIRDREQLTRQIAQEQDPKAREALELRREIEVADYMAITSRRIASQSEIITGRSNSEEAENFRLRASAYEAQSRELRQEYRELAAERSAGNAEAAPKPAEKPMEVTQPQQTLEAGQGQTVQAAQPTPVPDKIAEAAHDQSRADQHQSDRPPPESLRVAESIPGRGPEPLLDVVDRELDRRADEPPPRIITPAEYAMSAEARLAWHAQQGAEAARLDSFTRMGQDITAGRDLNVEDLRCLSKEDLRQVRAQGGAHLRELIAEHRREAGREGDIGGRERDRDL